MLSASFTLPPPLFVLSSSYPSNSCLIFHPSAFNCSIPAPCTWVVLYLFLHVFVSSHTLLSYSTGLSSPSLTIAGGPPSPSTCRGHSLQFFRPSHCLHLSVFLSCLQTAESTRPLILSSSAECIKLLKGCSLSAPSDAAGPQWCTPYSPYLVKGENVMPLYCGRNKLLLSTHLLVIQ